LRGLFDPGAKENPVLLRSLHTSSILESTSALAALKWENQAMEDLLEAICRFTLQQNTNRIFLFECKQQPCTHTLIS